MHITVNEIRPIDRTVTLCLDTLDENGQPLIECNPVQTPGQCDTVSGFLPEHVAGGPEDEGRGSFSFRLTTDGVGGDGDIENHALITFDLNDPCVACNPAFTNPGCLLPPGFGGAPLDPNCPYGTTVNSVLTPSPPQLTSPADNAVVPEHEILRWSARNPAVRFDLDVWDITENPEVLVVQQTNLNRGEFAPPANLWSAGRNYRWEVRTVRMTPPSLQSAPATREFRITPTDAQGNFRRGDADFSRVVDITDARNVLEFLILGCFQGLCGGQARLPCPDAADMDDSGLVDIHDPIVTLTWLFFSTPVPPVPGPNTCGADPSPDGLDCPGGCP